MPGSAKEQKGERMIAMKKAFFALAVAVLLGTAGAAWAETTVKLGVVGSIYDDLWAPAKAELAKEGINLELVSFSDYVTPNRALADGEIDLNAFQHDIYLQSEIKEYGYKLTNIGSTFITPMNLFSNKVKSVSEIKDGDVIAIPNDLTNGGRALKVLASAGLIKLKDNSNFSPTLEDVETYNVKITISELAANTITAALPDVTAAIINNTFALDFGLKAEDAIFKDTSINERPYWNLVAARTEDLSTPEKFALYEKVVKAFQSEATEKVFKEQFGGYMLAAGWDVDFLEPFRKQ